MKPLLPKLVLFAAIPFICYTLPPLLAPHVARWGPWAAEGPPQEAEVARVLCAGLVFLALFLTDALRGGRGRGGRVGAGQRTVANASKRNLATVGGVAGGPEEGVSHPIEEGADMTVIERAKKVGINALLRTYLSSTTRYDSSFSALRLISARDDGTCVLKLPVEKKVTNSYGTLHGGAISTIIDIAGTVAILLKDVQRPGVSVDLNVSFLSAVPEGNMVWIVAKCLKMGRKLAFTEVTLYAAENDSEELPEDLSELKVVATGRHTKAL